MRRQNATFEKEGDYLPQNVGTRVRDIRHELNLSQKELAAKAGISQSALSAIEKTEKMPTIETLNNIASALGVLVSDLMEEKFCPVCGFEYAYDEGLNSIAHQKRHAKAQEIIDKYGFFWPYRQRKVEATIAYTILANPKASQEEHYDAAIRLLKSLFSRSVLAYEFDDHPDFSTYVSMMLGSPDFANEIPQDTHLRLEAEYGRHLEGISHGAYYQRMEQEAFSPRVEKICRKLRSLPTKYLDVVEAICSLPE